MMKRPSTLALFCSNGLVLAALAIPCTLHAQASAPNGGTKPAAGAKGSATLSKADAIPAAPVTPPLSERLTGDAKTFYETGKLLFRENRDYESALIKFRSAYDLSKDPGLKWNMAACEKNLKHYAKTTQLVREYLAESGASISDEDRNVAIQLIHICEELTVNVKVTVNEPDAEIFIDGDKVAESPMSNSVFIDIGAHKVRVTKADFTEFTSDLKLGSSRDATVDVKLTKLIHEGKILITTTPDESTIAIDGRVVGTGSYAGSLSSGGHNVKVTASGKKPFVTDVLIEDNKSRTLNAKLERDGASTGLYFGIAGAIVVGAAGAIGAYFLLRPKDATPPSGTFDPGFVQVNRAGGIHF